MASRTINKINSLDKINGSVSDWNTTIQPGVYQGNANSLNSPVATTSLGIVIQLNNWYVAQLVFILPSNKIFYRTMDNQIWGAWEEISTK